MSRYPRYGIYFAPAPGSRWWRFGCEWLGRDAVSGRALEPMILPDLARDEIAAATLTPRHYGFHATLKPPFALTDGMSVDDLHVALRQFARKRPHVSLGQLSLHDMDGFIALRPIEKTALRELAAECVRHFDFLRAPASEAELARRRSAALTARQDALLQRWGYPHVLDEFRFHLTLTGRLDDARRRRIHDALVPLVQALNAEPLQVDALCLFEQRDTETPFRVTRRYGFDGTVTRYEGAEVHSHRGRLFYVVGPSGAGKDSLLRYLKERVGDMHSIAFTHRYITRAADAGGENHVALDPAEFAKRERAGAFALHWNSHGHRYGIGVEIDHWLERGLDVIVNGSRAHLARAFARYPDMTVVWITAPPELLRERLQQRGREADEAVESRLARAPAVDMPHGARVVEIVNDATLDRAGEQLVRVLFAA
jgi:phosphonate metabolism protein PhnN/1,5-bisphosphokinase (PRPP-forming)